MSQFLVKQNGTPGAITPQPTTGSGQPAAMTGPAPTNGETSAVDKPNRTAAQTHQKRLELGDFMLSAFGLLLLGAIGFSAGMSATMTLDGGIRVVLGSIIAGLIGYIYYGISGPGADRVGVALDDFAPVITTLASGLAGLLVTWWTIRRRG
jgi:hypothetical protein